MKVTLIKSKAANETHTIEKSIDKITRPLSRSGRYVQTDRKLHICSHGLVSTLVAMTRCNTELS